MRQVIHPRLPGLQFPSVRPPVLPAISEGCTRRCRKHMHDMFFERYSPKGITPESLPIAVCSVTGGLAKSVYCIRIPTSGCSALAVSRDVLIRHCHGSLPARSSAMPADGRLPFQAGLLLRLLPCAAQYGFPCHCTRRLKVLKSAPQGSVEEVFLPCRIRRRIHLWTSP